MNVRQRKKYLWSAVAIVGISAALLLGFGIFVPCGVQSGTVAHTSDKRASAAATPQLKSKKQLRYSITELKQISAKPLRQSLFPTQEELKPKVYSAGRLPVKISLAGTVIEDGHSMAMFKCPDNTIEICARGESFKKSGKEVKVLKINDMQVVVNCCGKTYELKIPKKRDSFDYFVTARPAKGDHYGK